MLVTHADLFDAVVEGAKWLAHVGDALYLFSLRLNRWFNHARAELGLPYWSLVLMAVVWGLVAVPPLIPTR